MFSGCSTKSCVLHSKETEAGKREKKLSDAWSYRINYLTHFWVIFITKKKTMLACRVICCSHQLDHCIWVYISHQSDFHIRVCILHQSNCLIRVCISHQSYYSIWISYANYSFWVLFLRKWCHWIRGLYTKNDIIQKFWVHLISIMVCDLRKSLLDWGWDLSGCERLTFNLFV